jgi:hypothetical protein
VRRTELRARLDPEHGGVGSSAVAAAAAARQEALTVKQAQLSAVLRAVDDNRDRLNQIESELLERRQVCIVTVATIATATAAVIAVKLTAARTILYTLFVVLSCCME